MAKIEIYARLRPTERRFDGLSTSHNNVSIQIGRKRDGSTAERFSSAPYSHHDFKFSRTFGEDATQCEVFETVARKIVDRFAEGYNGTVFAYGQTSTGKTYTMEGEMKRETDKGLIPRVLSYLYPLIEERKRKVLTNQSSSDTVDNSHTNLEDQAMAERASSKGERERQAEVKVYVSYMEIYQDTGFDLLNPGARPGSLMLTLPKVQISETPDGRVIVRDLSLHEAPTEQTALQLLMKGSACRKVAETVMNQSSSRSHSIFTITMTTRQPGSEVILRSKLNLVDLAGSERVSKTGSDGRILQEAKYINLSLHHLEHVIVALQQQSRSGTDSERVRRGHIPYRNSMLTMVLRDSLGGNCLTAMVATVSGEEDNILETISTLRFSQRVACISNTARRNEELDDKAVIRKLKKRVNELEKELISIRQHKSLPPHMLVKSDNRGAMSERERLLCHQVLYDFFHGKVVNPVEAGINTPTLFQECLEVLRDIVIDAVKSKATSAELATPPSPIDAHPHKVSQISARHSSAVEMDVREHQKTSKKGVKQLSHEKVSTAEDDDKKLLKNKAKKRKSRRKHRQNGHQLHHNHEGHPDDSSHLQLKREFLHTAPPNHISSHAQPQQQSAFPENMTPLFTGCDSPRLNPSTPLTSHKVTLSPSYPHTITPPSKSHHHSSTPSHNSHPNSSTPHSQTLHPHSLHNGMHLTPSPISQAHTYTPHSPSTTNSRQSSGIGSLYEDSSDFANTPLTKPDPQSKLQTTTWARRVLYTDTQTLNDQMRSPLQSHNNHSPSPKSRSDTGAPGPMQSKQQLTWSRRVLSTKTTSTSLDDDQVRSSPHSCQSPSLKSHSGSTKSSSRCDMQSSNQQLSWAKNVFSTKRTSRTSPDDQLRAPDSQMGRSLQSSNNHSLAPDTNAQLSKSDTQSKQQPTWARKTNYTTTSTSPDDQMGRSLQYHPSAAKPSLTTSRPEVLTHAEKPSSTRWLEVCEKSSVPEHGKMQEEMAEGERERIRKSREKREVSDDIQLLSLRVQEEDLRGKLESVGGLLARQHARVLAVCQQQRERALGEKGEMAGCGEDEVSNERLVEQQLRIRQARLHQKLLSLQQQIQSLRTSQTQISKSKTLSISPSSATTAATLTVTSLPKYTPQIMTNAVCSSESHGRKEGTFSLAKSEVEQLRETKLEKELELKEAATKRKMEELKRQLLSSNTNSTSPRETTTQVQSQRKQEREQRSTATLTFGTSTDKKNIGTTSETLTDSAKSALTKRDGVSVGALADTKASSIETPTEKQLVRQTIISLNKLRKPQDTVSLENDLRRRESEREGVNERRERGRQVARQRERVEKIRKCVAAATTIQRAWRTHRERKSHVMLM